MSRTTEAAKNERHLRNRYRSEALTALAQLAADIEELVYNAASPETIVERVQTLAQAAGLTRIGTASHLYDYDPTDHAIVGDEIPVGKTVEVMRPGYRLGDNLICRARVTA